jgi:hypothetical protein
VMAEFREVHPKNRARDTNDSGNGNFFIRIIVLGTNTASHTIV